MRLWVDDGVCNAPSVPLSTSSRMLLCVHQHPLPLELQPLEAQLYLPGVGIVRHRRISTLLARILITSANEREAPSCARLSWMAPKGNDASLKSIASVS